MSRLKKINKKKGRHFGKFWLASRRRGKKSDATGTKQKKEIKGEILKKPKERTSRGEWEIRLHSS